MFIEVSIHAILYTRQIYPADLFVRRKKYDVPVFQSRHPALNEYISGAVKAVGEELSAGNVDKVVMIVKDKKDVPLERYIFSVENMAAVEPSNGDTSVDNAMSTSALGPQFRSFLIKLNMIESQLNPLYPSDEVSFAIVLGLRDEKTSIRVGKVPPPWVPTKLDYLTSGARGNTEAQTVRAVTTGVINLSLVVQESEVKIHREKPPASLPTLEGFNAPAPLTSPPPALPPPDSTIAPIVPPKPASAPQFSDMPEPVGMTNLIVIIPGEVAGGLETTAPTGATATTQGQPEGP